MAQSTILGFPRMGRNRELKFAIESFWAGKSTFDQFQKSADDLRAVHWGVQKSAGIDVSPCNDFSFYDQMLDMSALLGVVPARYKWGGGTVDQATYFAMARGRQGEGVDAPACEMTKWFDTNYHYIVPEFAPGQNFSVSSDKPFESVRAAQAAGVEARPVLVGPMTYLMLGKGHGGVNPIDLLDRLVPVYTDILARLHQAGATWVQLDEPVLCLDLDPAVRAKFSSVYAALRAASPLKIFLATYFGALQDNAQTAASLPVDALHIDLVRAPEQLDDVLKALPQTMALSVGVVDGRNIWRTDLSRAYAMVERAVTAIGSDRVFVSASCSLLHSPFDLSAEEKLDSEIKAWLAFAVQKLDEIAILTRGANQGRAAIAAELAASDTAAAARATSKRIHNDAVKTRLKAQSLDGAGRDHAFPERQKMQRAKYQLPLYPTTTIGSLPQTADVRKARADYKAGRMTSDAYNIYLKTQIKDAVAYQEQIGIDVLVHGEFERNDMVEYFGEQLSGFAFTQNGWVQSYGSRCVKPPIIYGDVTRPHPMTVEWSAYAKSLTKGHMKGMLTGPVTILQWSFVRDDQPRSVTTHQIALALQDEVLDLERAGITIIQIDEPAFREGLPLRRADWDAYLKWAAQSFKLSFTGVRDDTQIHTHMCYCEFNDIIDSIKDLDADVISIETSRSQMELLEAFNTYKYPNEIGPGVYDIHSPRVPPTGEMVALLQKAATYLNAEQIWVNPDCGLKTRGWPETKAALENMVQAARVMRAGVPTAKRA
jgi:5-methyltetrahydropteroyltriglutamate--homocysteine methyltransferase